MTNLTSTIATTSITVPAAEAVETTIPKNAYWEFAEKSSSATVYAYDENEWCDAEDHIDDSAAIWFTGYFEDGYWVKAEQGPDNLEGVIYVDEDTLFTLVVR